LKRDALHAQVPVEQKTSKELVSRLKKFLKHPLTVAGALLLARFGIDLYTQRKLDSVNKKKRQTEEENHVS